MIEMSIGVVLALTVSGLGTVVGFDRDRAFYPTIMIVIASYYGLFAIMGGSVQALVTEAAVFGVFLAATVLAFKRSLWVIVMALAAHGMFDFTHGAWISNPGVPAWWPGFCLGYDVAAAGYLAWLLRKSSRIKAGLP